MLSSPQNFCVSTLRHPPVIVGALLKERRQALGLTQIEFADRLGVTHRSVQSWEAGQVPQPRYRQALADFFDANGQAA